MDTRLLKPGFYHWKSGFFLPFRRYYDGAGIASSLVAELNEPDTPALHLHRNIQTYPAPLPREGWADPDSLP
jgi:hypothetical protein